METRSQAKAHTRQKLLEAARDTVREAGPSVLSLRDVARRAGVVPSAVYRHFDSRDALLTQLILDSYAGLAESLEAAMPEPRAAGRPEEEWRRAADALRTWALSHRHEFLLIYGTPVPGYHAPSETIGAAARVASVFISRVGEGAAVDRAPAEGPLHAQLSAPAAQFGVSPAQLGRALAEVSQLVGVLVLELGGHFVGTADPADHLWDHVVTAQTRR